MDTYKEQKRRRKRDDAEEKESERRADIGWEKSRVCECDKRPL